MCRLDSHQDLSSLCGITRFEMWRCQQKMRRINLRRYIYIYVLCLTSLALIITLVKLDEYVEQRLSHTVPDEHRPKGRMQSHCMWPRSPVGRNGNRTGIGAADCAQIVELWIDVPFSSFESYRNAHFGFMQIFAGPHTQPRIRLLFLFTLHLPSS